MKSFKKSLVFLMAASLVFGTVAPAFAATPTDVVATSYEDAVGKLVALGVISGYEDGTFQPEKAITRAEFAKIACYVVGQQDAANLSKGSSTKFSDVPATHWASGFVSVASSQGLLKGYPNGTFKPEANVSYAEAITILVRALGMAPVVEGKGTWPANYMAKASEVGMFDEVTGLVGTENAVRGNIAKLSWNTLEADKWGAKDYNDKGEITYGSLNKTLLSYGYKDFADVNGDVKLYEDRDLKATRIVANGLNDNEVVFAQNIKTDVAGDTTYKVVDGLDLSNFIGCEVDVMLGKDDKVAFVKSNDTVVNGLLTEVKLGTPNKVVVNGKEYELNIAEGAWKVNYVSAATTGNYDTFAELKTALDRKNVQARLVVDGDNNKVTTMSVVIPDDSQQFVVKEIKSSGSIYAVPSTNTTIDIDELTNNDSKDQKETVFVKNGKVATAADIKAGDVVSVFGDYYFVTDNKVTGKVTAISGKKEITVNGVKYAVSDDAFMTKNGKVEDATAVDTTVTDFLNKDVTLSLNVVGEYVLVSGSVVSTAAEQYGLVTRAAWESSQLNSNGKFDYYMEVRATSGEKKIFSIKGSDDDINYYVKGNAVPALGSSPRNLAAVAPIRTLVQYKVEADGSLDPENIKVVPANDAALTSDYGVVTVSRNTVNTTVNDDAKAVAFGGHTYYFSNTDSVALNAADQDKEANWDAISAGDLNNLFVTSTATPAADAIIVYDRDTFIVKVVVVNGTALSSNDTYYGIITSDIYYAFDKDNKSVSRMKVYNDGTEKEYELTLNTVTQFAYNTVNTTPKVGDVLCYKLDSDGKIVTGTTVIGAAKKVILDNDNNNYDNTFVKSFSDNIVVFENDKNGVAGGSIKVESDAKVYTFDANGKPVMGSLSDIKAGVVAVTFDADLVGSTGYGLADVVVLLAK